MLSDPAQHSAAPAAPESTPAQVRAEVRAPIPAHVLLPDPDFLRPQASRTRPRKTEPRRSDAPEQESWWLDPPLGQGAGEDPGEDRAPEHGRDDEAPASAGEITEVIEAGRGASHALADAVARALRAQGELAMRAQANVFSSQARDLLR